MLVTTTLAEPVLVIVNGIGELVWLTGTEPKSCVPGDRVALALRPFPASVTECSGLDGALSVKFNVAERVPSAVGLKTRFRVAVPPAATVKGRLTLPKEKSPGFAPVNRRAVIDNDVVPGLVIVSG